MIVMMIRRVFVLEVRLVIMHWSCVKEANLFIGSHQIDVDRAVSVIEWWVEGK